MTEELRKVQSTLAERPSRYPSRQPCEASSIDCNQARVVMVNVLPPLFLNELNIRIVDGSWVQPPSRASDPLASVRLSSARHSCNSGEHSIREADEVEPSPDEELQDLKVADAQGTDKESHLSVQHREDVPVSIRGMASMVQHRPGENGTAASQTSEPTVCGDTALGAATATCPLVLSRLDSKCLGQELQKADEAWAQHVISNSTKGQAIGSTAFGTSQEHVAEVWRRVS